MPVDSSSAKLAQTALARTALPDAVTLLDYLMSHGLSVQLEAPAFADIVKTIARTRKAVEDGTLDSTLAWSFLESFGILSDLAYPVTPQTIAASRHVKLWILTLPVWIAFLATFALTLAASFNMTLVNDIQSGVEQQFRQALDLSFAVAMQRVGGARAPADTGEDEHSVPSETTTSLNAAPFFAARNASLISKIHELQRWIVRIPGVSRLPQYAAAGRVVDALTVVPGPVPTDPQQLPAFADQELKSYHDIRGAAQELMQFDDLIFAPFNTYVAPALYGLLGAILYNLRTDMASIRLGTLAPRRRSLMRYLMGLVCGLIAGQFFRATGSFSLSMVAIAFLAGYSVDLVFAAIDQQIETFTRLAGPRQRQGLTDGPRPASAAEAAGGTRPIQTPTRIADIAVLTRAVNESVTSVFAPPEFINYSGTLGVDLRDAAGNSAIASHGGAATMAFTEPGLYQLSISLVPEGQNAVGAARIPIRVDGGRPPTDGRVPFELRVDLGFASVPLRRHQVTIDAATASKIDLGGLEVRARDDGKTPILPDYPFSVTAYQHGQRCATCVVMPAAGR
jgi:hypothetical protein